ncbi:MAG: hypothetical protein NC341_01245 [Blautia sp.]|nr:hypothetical protein [Blautia sp.]MCM1201143.1 hypothetical protein [Bacteroides fragilis]
MSLTIAIKIRYGEKDRTMNYENLYQSLQTDQKALKDSIASLQKFYKAISREMEGGELRNLVRDLDSMKEAADRLTASLGAFEDTVKDFDSKAYFENGEFTEQMLDICREKGVDVRGEFPVYEMFPYRVKVDTENQELYLDRKKVQCMRPQSFVGLVQRGQEKLNKASFNAQTFVNELADAYDLALMKLNKNAESDVYLTGLYKFLAPMSRFRKDYDQQNFAFDLARLYISDIEETKNGRKFQFGPSRNNNKAIRILDRDGREQYLATIRFYK